MTATRAFAALFFLATACNTIPDVVDPPGPPVPDEAGDASDCEAACATLARLQCPGWRGSPGPDEIVGTADDVPCARACRAIVSSDRTVTLQQRCTATATTCEAVDRCFDSE